MDGADRIREVLSSTIDMQRIDRGMAAVEALHQRFSDLINERHEHVEPCGPYDDCYTTWYCYCLTPALQEIGRPGWVDRHFWDFSRLATSAALGSCCRRTLGEMFGVEALHVAIQANPVSDGLAQALCHHPGDRLAWIRHVAGWLTLHVQAFGSYPPPGLYEPGRALYRQAGRSAFDCQPHR